MTLRDGCAQKRRQLDGFRHRGTVVDALDRRIMRIVQGDCSMSAGALAERCGTTESTARRRIRALVKAGVLSPPAMRVAPERVGRGLSIILSIRLERETPVQLEAFRRKIAAHPDVASCYFVTGTWDYIIVLNVGRMDDYDRFLKETIVGQPAVVASDTHVVIQALKAGAPLPIDEPPQLASA